MHYGRRAAHGRLKCPCTQAASSEQEASKILGAVLHVILARIEGKGKCVPNTHVVWQYVTAVGEVLD